MSESLHAPPKSGGNGTFIAVAVIMLLAAGGLVVWKMAAGDEEPPAEKPKAAVKKPKRRLEAPPPPPPPVVKDAGPDAPEEKKVVRKGGGGVNPCAAKVCKGKATAALKSALRSKAGASRRCYERALQSNEGLSGRVVVSVRVGPQGQVCSAGVASDSVGGGVGQCALAAFRSGSLPPPAGGCVDTQVPMSFKPQGK